MFRRDPFPPALRDFGSLLQRPEREMLALLPLARAAMRFGGVVGVLRAGQCVVVPFGGVLAGGVFELASVTKPFTAALVDSLVRSGALSWDMRIASLGGPFRRLPPALTPYRLATHTAGLPYHPARTALTTFTQYSDPYGGMSPADVLASARRWARPQNPPQFMYSNLGAGVLALAAAYAGAYDCSAAGYGAALAHRVTGPLGLSDITLSPDPARPNSVRPSSARLVTPRGWLGATDPTSFGELAGAGGLYGTAADLLTFAQAHLSGEAGTYWQAAQSPPGLRPPHVAVAPGWFYSGGFYSGAAQHSVVWHDGVARGTRTALGFCPATGAAAVVLARGGVPVGPLAGPRQAVPLLLLGLLGMGLLGG